MLLLELIGLLLGVFPVEMGSVVTSTTRKMEEFCGLSSVPVNKGNKFVLVANSETWEGMDTCKVVIASIVNEKIYLGFSKYVINDCGVKVKLYWGNHVGKKEFTCNHEPDLYKSYHHGDATNVTIEITGAESPHEKYLLEYEITSDQYSIQAPSQVKAMTTTPSRGAILSPCLISTAAILLLTSSFSALII